MERPPESVKPHDERPEWRSFRRAWRDAARRPPRLPPDEAARGVLLRLEPRPRRRTLLRWGAAAALAALVLALISLLPSGRQRQAVQDQAGGDTSIPLDDGIVLLWLDAETPLYMTFVPPRKERASS